MHRPGLKIFRLCVGIVACLNLSVLDSPAQDYPVRPIRMLVGFTVGGVGDITARLVAQKLSEPLGQHVVVENRGGASGAIATERVATSTADGYTLLLMTAVETVILALRTRLPYKLERDLAPVSLVAIAPFVLVIPQSMPARTVKELIALARSQPGKLSYGSVGAGSTPHLAGELLKSMAGVRIVHVPYKGGGESVIATASGQVDIGFHSATAALPLVEAGKLRALGVNSAKRASFLPSIPTIAESGLPGFDRSSWNGVLAPAGVPRNIIARLNAAIGKVVNTVEMRESFRREGLEPQTNTPEQFAAFIQGELEKNSKLIKSIGLKAE